MEKLTKKYPITEFGNPQKYIDEHTLFCDIETLGFSSAYLPIYMIGVAYMEGDSIVVTLFFADSPNDESECIEAFLDLSKNYSKFITFNGETFDIPYIKNRAAKFGFDCSLLDRIESFDLLKIVRKYKKILHLEKCNQKTVELFLGINREDTYSGGELIDVYKEYTSDKDEEKKQLLITHNFDDVCGMIRLLPILSYCSLDDPKFTIDYVSFEDDEEHLILKGSSDSELPVPLRLQSDNYYIAFEENRINAALRQTEGTLKYFLPYPSKYVYLIKEETVVPKKLATTIDSANKRPAKADECFVEALGVFVAVDMMLIKKNPSFFSDVKIFHFEPGETVGYIKTDAQPDNEWLSKLVRLIIKSNL